MPGQIAGEVEKPATNPWLLMAVPRFTVPPSELGSLVIVYCRVAWLTDDSGGWVT